MRALLWFVLLTIVSAPATAVLTIDPTQSTLTPTVGSVETLSGTLNVKLGDPLPIVANTTFDVGNLDAQASGGASISLDSSLQNPAAGVLSPSGNFLIPNLFLELDDGSLVPLTVPNVAGSYGDFAGCPGKICLETTFDVDTGGPSGIVTVHLFAIPEPTTATLVALGLLGLACGRRLDAAGRPR